MNPCTQLSFRTRRGICIFLCLLFFSVSAFAQSGGELRFCLRSEPKTFDPLLVDDDSSLSIRYLTGGVLLRVAPGADACKSRDGFLTGRK